MSDADILRQMSGYLWPQGDQGGQGHKGQRGGAPLGCAQTRSVMLGCLL